MDKDVIKRKWRLEDKLDRLLIVIPEKMVDDILYECHDNSGHCGNSKTIANVRQNWHWWGLKADCNSWILSCETCQRRKQGTQNKAKLMPLPKSYFGERIHVDLKVLNAYETASGNKYIMVIKDSHTRYTKLVATQTKEARELITKIHTVWVCVYGTPKILESDNEMGLKSTICQAYYEVMGISHQVIIPFSPQSNGMVEITMKETSRIIKAMCITDENTSEDGTMDVSWDARLPMVEMAINSVPSIATEISPFEAFCGRIFKIPGSMLVDVPQEKRTVHQSVRQLRNRQKRIYDFLLDKNEKTLLQTKNFMT